MAEIVNARDVYMRLAASRLVEVIDPNAIVVPGYTGVQLFKSTNVFLGSISAGISPSFIEITAQLRGIPATQTITWNVIQGPNLLTDTADPLVKVILAEDMSVFPPTPQMLITASVNFAGQTFTSNILSISIMVG